MNDDVKQRAEEVALFRHGVIGELVHLEPGTKGLYAKLQEKAAIDFKIPGSLRTRVAAETIRGWLRDYRKGGFDALKPRVRRDHGQSHALPQEVADLLVSIKDEQHDLSVHLVIQEALASGKVPAGLQLAPSTVHRLLSRAGLMKRRPGEPTTKDHRRFSFEKAGDLWMSDVMHGPAVFVAGKKRKAYLIAFIDDATRVVPFAAFALSENTAAFLPVLKEAVLKEAVLRRGACRRLFVDNGSAFKSHHLAVVCAKLGITLIHARVHHAQAKGYASYCSSSVACAVMLRRRFMAAMPLCFFRMGASVPGGSKRCWPLSLYAWARDLLMRLAAHHVVIAPWAWADRAISARREATSTRKSCGTSG